MRQLSVISLIFSLLLILSCEDDKDTTPPKVTIIAPSGGTTVNELVDVTCMATDNKEVLKVELWVDGVNTGLTDDTEPYSFQWNTTKYNDGDHTLIIRGYDTRENEGDSAPVTVKVDNTISVPNPVDITEVSYTFTEMTVKWTESTDNDFDEYKLLHSDSELGTKTILSTYKEKSTITYTTTTFDPTKENWFWVEVADTFGYSIIGTGKTNTIDEVPKNVEITTIDYDLNGMVINWEFSTENDFASYELMYSNGELGQKNTISIFNDINTTTYSTTNFDPTQERWYWIKVYDHWGQTNISSGYKLLDMPPSQSNFRPIIYENNSFPITWSENVDSDFLSYTLFESSKEDMSDKIEIFTSNNNASTTHTVTGIGEDEYRYYQLIVEDIWELKTNSLITGSSHPKIIYNSSTELTGSEEINIMNYNGSSQFKLTNNMTIDHSPIFIPAGNKILFIGTGPSGHSQFFTMNLDGTNLINISNNDRNHSFPNITSDGLKIIYESSRRISIMDVDGGNQIDLKTRNNNVAPNLSSDNKTIVFATQEWGGLNEIGLINIDGSNLKRVTYTPNIIEKNPRFTPDGQNILALVNNGTLIKMDLDGNNRITLSEKATGGYLDISPNGEKVVFLSHTNEIYVINIDGSNLTQISTGLSSAYDPRFSSDGSKVLFHTEEKSGDIFMMNPDGTELINLTNSTTIDRSPKIQPRK